MNQQDKTQYKSKLGCTLCRKLHDGLCANYCQLTKEQRKSLMTRLKITEAE